MYFCFIRSFFERRLSRTRKSWQVLSCGILFINSINRGRTMSGRMNTAGILAATTHKRMHNTSGRSAGANIEIHHTGPTPRHAHHHPMRCAAVVNQAVSWYTDQPSTDAISLLYDIVCGRQFYLPLNGRINFNGARNNCRAL